MPNKALNALKKIHWLSGFLSNISLTGSTLIKLSQTQGDLSPSLTTASLEFQRMNLALSIINFLRIPLLFLAAAILKEKLPFTVSKGAQWAYAGILLGLGIATFVIPTIAAILGLVTTIFVLSVSIFTLGYLFYRRSKIKKELEEVNKAIREQMEQLNEKQLNAECNPTLHALYDKKELLEHKLAKKGTFAVVDKGTGISLTCVALAGAIMSLFFPFSGLVIMVAASGAGLVYCLGRIIYAISQSKLGSDTKDAAAEIELGNLSTELMCDKLGIKKKPVPRANPVAPVITENSSNNYDTLPATLSPL